MASTQSAVHRLIEMGIGSPGAAASLLRGAQSFADQAAAGFSYVPAIAGWCFQYTPDAGLIDSSMVRDSLPQRWTHLGCSCSWDAEAAIDRIIAATSWKRVRTRAAGLGTNDSAAFQRFAGISGDPAPEPGSPVEEQHALVR